MNANAREWLRIESGFIGVDTKVGSTESVQFNDRLMRERLSGTRHAVQRLSIQSPGFTAASHKRPGQGVSLR